MGRVHYLRTAILYIYSGVGYRVVYLIQGFVRTSYLINEFSSTLSVFTITRHRGVGTAKKFGTQTSNSIAMEKLFYSAPVVRELPLKIERGFAASLEDPITDPEIEW